MAVPSSLLRVTVTASDRRVDLAVPGEVPVAELVPALARGLGLLDAATVHAGLRLVTVAGRVLDPAGGLAAQGIDDGALLALTPAPDSLVRLHDDLAEAMAEVTDREPRLSERAAAERVHQAVGVAVLALGVAGVVAVGTTIAAVAGVAVALGLVGVAGALSHRSPGTPTWLVALLAATGTAYAAGCGSILASVVAGGPALPLVGAGSGAVLTGVVAQAVLARGRSLALPPVLVGGALAAAAVPAQWTGAPVAVVLTIALAVVVLGVGSAPRLALASTGTGVAPIGVPQSPLPHAPVDLDRLETSARLARERLLAAALAVGLFLVLLVPVAVSRGVPGALVAAACSLVVLLRTRGHRGGPEVAVALASGALGLVMVAVSALVLQPGWRPVTALLVLVAGAAVAATSLLPAAHPGRWTRLADLVESTALASLPPSVLLVSGALARILG